MTTGNTLVIWYEGYKMMPIFCQIGKLSKSVCPEMDGLPEHQLTHPQRPPRPALSGSWGSTRLPGTESKWVSLPQMLRGPTLCYQSRHFLPPPVLLSVTAALPTWRSFHPFFMEFCPVSPSFIHFSMTNELRILHPWNSYTPAYFPINLTSLKKGIDVCFLLPMIKTSKHPLLPPKWS